MLTLAEVLAMRDPEPEWLSRASSEFLTHRNRRVINVSISGHSVLRICCTGTHNKYVESITEVSTPRTQDEERVR